MNRSTHPRTVGATDAGRRALALGVIAALAAAGTVNAQTVPYQSLDRSRFGTGLGQTALPKGGTFEPRVEATLQYVSNFNLAADGDPQIDMAGLEVAPGFYAAYSSGTAIGAIDYSLIGRAWEESDFNDVSHRLNANGQWGVVPDWFSLRGDASYSDGIIDPRYGLNYGGLGLFGPRNLTEIATASVNPILQHRFNSLEFTAQYRYGRVWYLDEGKGQEPVVGFVSNQDSTDQSANVSLGTADTGGPLFAMVYYDWNRSEFETALPFVYERAGLSAGYQVSRTLTLLGDVGSESDLEASTTQGGLDSTFWNLGVRWEPNDRTSAEARYGERFFGNSWSLSARHRARLLEFTASYSEQPMVQTRRLSLGDFDPGDLPPGVPDVDFGRFNSTPFIARDARIGVSAQGSRTTLRAAVFRNERDYIRNNRQDETFYGANAGASRQLASNLSADFDVNWRKQEYSVDETLPNARTSSYRDTTVTARLNRRSGERLTLSLEAGYLTRSSNAPEVPGRAQDYDGWWTGLRARWTP